MPPLKREKRVVQQARRLLARCAQKYEREAPVSRRRRARVGASAAGAGACAFQKAQAMQLLRLVRAGGASLKARAAGARRLPPAAAALRARHGVAECMIAAPPQDEAGAFARAGEQQQVAEAPGNVQMLLNAVAVVRAFCAERQGREK